MAQIPTVQDLNQLVTEEESVREAKKQAAGNPDWKPLGDEHSSGVMPEEVWKNFKLDSNPNTAHGTVGGES